MSAPPAIRIKAASTTLASVASSSNAALTVAFLTVAFLTVASIAYNSTKTLHQQACSRCARQINIAVDALQSLILRLLDRLSKVAAGVFVVVDDAADPFIVVAAFEMMVLSLLRGALLLLQIRLPLLLQCGCHCCPYCCYPCCCFCCPCRCCPCCPCPCPAAVAAAAAPAAPAAPTRPTVVVALVVDTLESTTSFAGMIYIRPLVYASVKVPSNNRRHHESISIRRFYLCDPRRAVTRAIQCASQQTDSRPAVRPSGRSDHR